MSLRERLARPEMRPLCDELVRRWEASNGSVTSITLRDLDDATRRSVADLLGSDKLPARTMRIAISRLCSSLRTDIDGLRAAVVELRGPLRDRATERLERTHERAELWQWVERESVRLGVPEWSQRLRSKGVIGGAHLHRVRLEVAVAVLDRLPADDVPLAGFACDITGDPHALDHGTWLGNAILDAIAERSGTPTPATAEDARRLWSSVGVLPDGFSSNVLSLGLRSRGDDPVARLLHACADACEPAALTESQLRRWPVRTDAPAVYAFENPSILAQAARQRWDTAPLVCTSGWPNVAAITLLRQLIESGTTVRYHGDFDAKGLEIAQMLRTRLGIEPWKMSARDYEAHAPRAGVAISGAVPDADWDPDLAVALRTHATAVFEEDIRHGLLAAITQACG